MFCCCCQHREPHRPGWLSWPNWPSWPSCLCSSVCWLVCLSYDFLLRCFCTSGQEQLQCVARLGLLSQALLFEAWKHERLLKDFWKNSKKTLKTLKRTSFQFLMFLGRFGLFRFVYLVLRIHRVIPAYLESLAQGWVPRNLWKCSGKYFEISWVCHLDRLMNEVRGLRPLQRMKTIFKWEFWVDHLVYKVWRGREGWESKEKGEYKHTSCDKSWEHSSHSYYSCLQTYESVWICMKYELNWIESYRIRISHNVPDVSSSSHRPMELKERYAILQCQFTKFSTNLRFGPISTSISSMVLIQLFFWISAVWAAYFWRLLPFVFFVLHFQRRTLLRTRKNGTSQRAGDPLFGWSGAETWHEIHAGDPQPAFLNGLRLTNSGWRAIQSQALRYRQKTLEDSTEECDPALSLWLSSAVICRQCRRLKYWVCAPFLDKLGLLRKAQTVWLWIASYVKLWLNDDKKAYKIQKRRIDFSGKSRARDQSGSIQINSMISDQCQKCF